MKVLMGSAIGAPTCPECQAAVPDRRQEPYGLLGADTLLKVDRYPIVFGHVLLFPRAHISDVFVLEDTEYDALMTQARAVANILKDISGVPRIGLFTSGKEVSDHCHIHLLPLARGLKATFERLSETAREELAPQLQERLVSEILRRVA
jgi:diadenosine tetraphosphate (Ap4A) HIT family hydrolase